MWMIDRVKGTAGAAETPIGLVPAEGALNVEGLGLGRADVERLLAVDRDEWAAEVPEIRAFFDRFEGRLPAELSRALESLSQQVATTRV
jgi:phosphoenolpyruvate carboxykinase (GTP)